jgi:hypothetical protein
MAKIVFVYLGSPLPRYAVYNLRRTRRLFPDHEVVLISDSLSNGYGLKGISFYLVPEMKTQWSDVFSSMSHDPNFRQSFWFNSLARFMAIKIYMEAMNDEPIIHLELDVWISENFPFLNFQEIKELIAFTLPSDTEGSAAILYLKNRRAINELVKCSEQIIKRTPSASDMTILREIYDLNLIPNRILPSRPAASNKKDSVFDSSLFDPSSWGMYLLGQDPRNHKGRQIIHMTQAKHYIHGSEFKYLYENRSVKVFNNGDIYNLVTLHVHSKDLRIFSNFYREERLLRKRIGSSANGEFYEMKLNLFFLLVARKFKKEMIRFFNSGGRAS